MNRFIATLGMALLWCLGMSSAAQAGESVQTHRLQLQWEVQRSVFSPDFPDGRSLATLTLTNHAEQPLPAQGWSLYLNTVAGLDTKPVRGDFTIEHLVGTLYRLRPTPGATALKPGEAMQWSFMHPEVMVKSVKAPQGPYIVFDHQPEVGHAISDYRLVPLVRAEQWSHGPRDPAPLFTPEMAFERNAKTLDLAINALPPVFPTPLEFKRLPGTLHWQSMPAIVTSAALQQEAVAAKRMLANYFPISNSNQSAPALRMAIGQVSGQSSDEAYELSVNADTGVQLTGRSAAAIARGLQSLQTLLPLPDQRSPGVQLPAIHITDAPRFAYRGFMLDVARNFHPKETVFRLLDLMARYKLNKFHFHLTDDEGWRLEIPGLPELTTVGGRRGHSTDPHGQLPPAYGSGPDVKDPHGSGFYTAEDYMAIVRYAAARHIEVVPEIEMPGHARAAVKAMESRYLALQKAKSPRAKEFLLHDLLDQSKYVSAQLYTDHVMNPGLPSTYAFIEKVAVEVKRLHRKAGVPLRNLHVGADELPNGAWEKSPATRALMQREKLADGNAVWDYFYNRVDRILRKNGLASSGWEELGARKEIFRGAPAMVPNPRFVKNGFTLYVWNDLGDAEDLAYRMANAGYRTILAPATHLYFDMSHNKNPQEPGVNWAAYVDLETVFDFVPFDFVKTAGRDRLSESGKKNIIGLQGTLFTETVRDASVMDYLLMPRMLALAERAWAADPAWTHAADPTTAKKLHQQSWSVFANQLGKVVLPKLNAQIPGVQYRIAPPGLKVMEGKVHANHQLPGFTLRYTTDGSEPTTQSATVAGPLNAHGLIKVAAFDSAGRKGWTAQVENP
jgi:hexosaminidase